MSCRGCVGAAHRRRCPQLADIVVTSGGGPDGSRVYTADTGEHAIELPSGWRRTPAGLTASFFNVAPSSSGLTPPATGVNYAGLMATDIGYPPPGPTFDGLRFGCGDPYLEAF